MNQKYKGLVLVVLLLFILAAFFSNRSCDRNNTIAPAVVTTKVLYDTVYVTRDTIIYKTVLSSPIIRPVGILPKEYQADKDVDILTKRFNNLVLEHAGLRVYKDQFPLDSLGSITITDTVQFNKFKGKRSYKFDYKIPIVTKTVTVTNTLQAIAKRQVYVGANILIDRTLSESVVTAGLLYKDRKDRIFTVNVGPSSNGTLYAGIGSYWKLKF
jgi:hypothetical protein